MRKARPVPKALRERRELLALKERRVSPARKGQSVRADQRAKKGSKVQPDLLGLKAPLDLQAQQLQPHPALSLARTDPWHAAMGRCWLPSFAQAVPQMDRSAHREPLPVCAFVGSTLGEP